MQKSITYPWIAVHKQGYPLITSLAMTGSSSLALAAVPSKRDKWSWNRKSVRSEVQRKSRAYLDMQVHFRTPAKERKIAARLELCTSRFRVLVDNVGSGVLAEGASIEYLKRHGGRRISDQLKSKSEELTLIIVIGKWATFRVSQEDFEQFNVIRAANCSWFMDSSWKGLVQ